MSATIQRVTGMQDVLPEDRRYWDAILAVADTLPRFYGFERVELPVIEYTDLFVRGVGTGSDFFVQKEMYTIEEPDETSITLRPEFTAGFMRAYIQNGMANWTQPVKLYTIGPAFRRERPQAGRYRQHSQLNCEILGESDPAADVEVMLMNMDILRRIGFVGTSFQLNSTGCPDCRPGYIELLSAYLREHEAKLADIDRERLRRNPLRVLDSKERGMDELLAGAPHIADHLCEDCASHFAEVRGLLDSLDQPYGINYRLVRGIDYYTKTVYEIWQEGIGAQGALCGGGRYDGLAEDIGGPPTPGVGFGFGIERVMLGMIEQGIEPAETAPLPVMIVHFGGATKEAANGLSYLLRDAGIGTRLAFGRQRRSMKSQMREADRRGARYVVIAGEQELADGVVAVKPLGEGEQTLVPTEDLVSWLAGRLA